MRKTFIVKKSIAFISIKFLGRETFDKVYNRTNERSADPKQEEQRRKLYNGKVERSAVCPIIGFFSDFAPHIQQEREDNRPLFLLAYIKGFMEVG